MARYKYICDECGEATFLNARERTRRAGMQCQFCGCRRLEPSRCSEARTVLPAHHDIKMRQDAISDAKMGIV